MRNRARYYSAVKSEGGLLPQDVLDRIKNSDATIPGTIASTYHLQDHERIGDAVNRAWTRLLTSWNAFQNELTKVSTDAPTTGLTRERWLLPLFQELGYGRLTKSKAVRIDNKSFAISHTWHHSPIHLLGCRVDLDRRQKGVAGAASASPHGLVQDFLNRSEDHLWGFLSNGYKLRILRDHHSLTRQAYVEFDLQMIMEGEQYSEFLLLWMLCHQSRVEHEQPSDCYLEQWTHISQNEGIRALDKLHGGVERAIESLGTGFLSHRKNTKLRDALKEGTGFSKEDYYHQLLRLVYRLIFIFVAEERDALLDPNASQDAKARYLDFYSTHRLRLLASKRRGGPHTNLWRGLTLVLEKLDGGYADLALPALGSFLWSDKACPWLMEAQCSNEHLLNAIRHLSIIQDGKTRFPVNWKNIGADELGSVYESLLERRPILHLESATFELQTAAGNERKTTGSYYTPAALVDCLLDSALDPVLDEAAKQADPEQAILALNICDPACGSGHFLVAAARRMAKRLAGVRSGEDEPGPTQVQIAIRDIIGHCIYGVDLNPMAVELCKVSLWMEAIEPGKPLSFLDSHIQHGNALLGATPALMKGGIPDNAFKPIEGDDKKIATKLKAKNRKERKAHEAGQSVMFGAIPHRDHQVLTSKAIALEEVSDDTIFALKKKEDAWNKLNRSAEYRDELFRANAWCSAFIWPKQEGENYEAAITESVWRLIEKDASTASMNTRKEVRALAKEHVFFHWHLAFPTVFGSIKDTFDDAGTTGWEGGFDVVLGNPPWDQLELQEVQYFTTRSTEVVGAKTAAIRKNIIASLKELDPILFFEYKSALLKIQQVNAVLRHSARYPFCARGRINTYSIFSELNRTLIHDTGRVGCIVQSGIATDDTTKFFFQDLILKKSLTSFYDFENKNLFPAVDSRMRFCLITMSGSARPIEKPQFAFFLHAVEELKEKERVFHLRAEDIMLINPNTGTCPIFRSRKDAEITKYIYRRVPVLIREARQDLPEANPWAVKFSQGLFNMSGHSSLFKSKETLSTEGWTREGNRFSKEGKHMLPLYEAKMAHQFNHRFGDYEDQPLGSKSTQLQRIESERLQDPTYTVSGRHWVADHEVESKLADRWDHDWLMGWRDICRSTDVRTVIASVIPRVAVGDKLLLIFSFSIKVLPPLLNAIVFDYCARQKQGGTSLKYFTFKQLPVLPPSSFETKCDWTKDQSVCDFTIIRTLELVYTAWDLEGFGKDCNYAGPPFVWNEERRFLIQAELDATFFHLYLGTQEDWKNGDTALLNAFPTRRDAVDYILESFPIVKKKDVKKYGDYRTKIQILEIFDAMQKAIDEGGEYQTLLDPPPGDPSLSHPENTRPDWAKKNESLNGEK